MNAHTKITVERINAQLAAARGKRMTQAEAMMIVAAERGPRPIVRVPYSTSYPGMSNHALLHQQWKMHADITAREEWDRAVKAVLARPLTDRTTEE